MDLEQIRAKINSDYFKISPPYVSKYLPLLPIKNYNNFVSLEEGATPLIKSNVIGPRLGIDLYFKLEMQNPTGSFKDRGSAVDLTIAKEFNAKAIVVASTGNMAASCACYAAVAHLPCFIFVPEGTPASKLSQAISYGGRIVQIKGTYNDAAQLAETIAKEMGFYLGGDYAFRVEGQKTAAFEVIDQLFFQVPDAVLIPIGCGTNVTAYGKGFEEYRELGFINSIPRIIGTQAEGAACVVNAFKKGSREIEPLKSVDTIATAIGVNTPLDGIKALDAIYRSNGQAVAVSDNEMLQAQYELSCEEGLFVETSCASTIATLKRLAKEQDLRGQRIVCVMTGGGLKDPTAILRIAIKPPTIYPDMGDFLALYNNSFFEGKSVAFVAREEVVFRSEPSREDLKKKLKNYFDIDYGDKHISQILGIMKRVFVKGKPVTFADLQDIVQDALETLNGETADALKVRDFKVTTGLNRKAQGKVKVLLHDTERTATASGVGPVDAVLQALKDACGELINYYLSDYRVQIRGQGADAVVHVEIKLKNEGILSVGTGISPDIIQASIEAFEKAYNGFFKRSGAAH